jgi:hypothetical protein
MILRAKGTGARAKGETHAVVAVGSWREMAQVARVGKGASCAGREGRKLRGYGKRKLRKDTAGKESTAVKAK